MQIKHRTQTIQNTQIKNCTDTNDPKKKNISITYFSIEKKQTNLTRIVKVKKWNLESRRKATRRLLSHGSSCATPTRRDWISYTHRNTSKTVTITRRDHMSKIGNLRDRVPRLFRRHVALFSGERLRSSGAVRFHVRERDRQLCCL